MGACQKDSQSEGHFSKILACRHTIGTHRHTRIHTHTLFILSTARGHLPNQVHPSIHTRSYCISLIWCLDWQYQLLAWLRWWRHRKDGGCHPMWVTGTWDVHLFINFHPEEEMRWQSSSHAVYPFIGQCVYFTSSSWCSFVSSLCPPVCFSLSVFLSCLSHRLSHPLSFLFFFPEWWVDESRPFIPVAVTASRETM